MVLLSLNIQRRDRTSHRTPLSGAFFVRSASPHLSSTATRLRPCIPMPLLLRLFAIEPCGGIAGNRHSSAVTGSLLAATVNGIDLAHSHRHHFQGSPPPRERWQPVLSLFYKGPLAILSLRGTAMVHVRLLCTPSSCASVHFLHECISVFVDFSRDILVQWAMAEALHYPCLLS